jgi:hypothetical protein
MNMTIEEYQKKFKPEEAVGWNCIDLKLNEVYKNIAPRHYAASLHYIAGGNDPLDGVSIYDNKKQLFHHHLVSYGFSELYYNEHSAGAEFSKFGFELTFRLKPFVEDNGDPFWAIQVMNNLARYVFETGNWFEENQYLPAKGPIRLETNTKIIGFVFTIDPELGKIQTPNGELNFIQMVGITEKELLLLKTNSTMGEVEKLIFELKKDNPLLITDLERQ